MLTYRTLAYIHRFYNHSSRNDMYKRLVFCMLGICLSVTLSAQKLGIKTNLLYDATATFNIGIEIGMAPHWSLDISGNYNPWTFNDNKKWKHYLIQPEVRYWFRDRFDGHFVGLHAGYINYNAGGVNLLGIEHSEEYRYEGNAVIAGLSYGYVLALGKHWNMEFTAGAGWIHARYDQFRCAQCGVLEQSEVTANRLIPTKLGVALIYILK